MCCADYAERSHPCNQLYFMLHELVLLWYHSQFASYPYLFVSDSYSCKILQPYVVATVREHSDAVFSSIGGCLMKTFTKNQCSSTNSILCKQLPVRTHQTDTCELAFTPTFVFLKCLYSMENVTCACTVICATC